MFCSQCGSELIPGAAFCLKCGQPVSVPPKEEAEAPRAPAVSREAKAEAPRAFVVTFVRESQRYAVNPAVKIIVDDKDEYRIDNGQTLRIPMAPGTHNIVFKCGIRNKIIDLTVQQDLALHLTFNRLTGSLTVK